MSQIVQIVEYEIKDGNQAAIKRYSRKYSKGTLKRAWPRSRVA